MAFLNRYESHRAENLKGHSATIASVDPRARCTTYASSPCVFRENKNRNSAVEGQIGPTSASLKDRDIS